MATQSSTATLLDEYVAAKKLSAEQITAITATVDWSELVGGDDLDATALVWTREAGRLAKLDPDDQVARFLRDAAVRLTAARFPEGLRP